MRKIAPLPFCAALPMTLSFSTTADSQVWQSIGPDGGAIDGFAQAPTEPNRIYCLVSGQGAFRSDDRGETWTRVDQNLPLATSLRRIAVSPVDADLVIAGQRGIDFRRSTDGGQTWTAIPAGLGPSASVNAITFDPIAPDRVFAAVTQGDQPGIHRSTDGGLTWARANSDPLGATSIAVHPAEPGVALAGTAAGVYRTTDGGSSWEPTDPSLGAVGVVDFCAAAPSRAWASTSFVIYRSDDAGLSFQPTPSPLPLNEESIAALAAHRANPDAVLAGRWSWGAAWDGRPGLTGVLRTTNGGATWLVATAGLDSMDPFAFFTGIAFDVEQPSTAWVTTAIRSPTGLLRSLDAGASWVSSMRGIHGVGIFGLVRDAGALYARRDGTDGLWRAGAVGAPWETRTAPAAGLWLYVLTCFDANRRSPGLLQEGGYFHGWDTLEDRYSQSTDGGERWWFSDSLAPSCFYCTVDLVVSNHGDGGTLYAWLGSTLYRSDDGVSFDQSFPSFWAKDAIMDPVDPLRIFACRGFSGGTGDVELSTDGGASWSDRSAGLPSLLHPVRIFMDPDAAARLALVYREGEAYRSDDGGLRWRRAPLYGGPGASGEVITSDVTGADWDPAPDRFAIATASQGALISDRGFVTAGLPSLQLTSILFVPGGIPDVHPPHPPARWVIAGTTHTSVFMLDLAAPTASVRDSPGEDIRLLARPNPSRRSVHLELALPDGNVIEEIAIYDVTGRRVATLAKAVRAGGSFVWDGRGDRGERVAPGTYFIRLDAGGETVTRKVVLLSD